jgi:hypothetical protein
MPKKNNVTEVLRPADPAMNVRAQLEQFIEQKVAEMMGDKTDGIFEPFFQTQAITTAIRKMETVTQQRKWHNYFEEWGCLVCGKKDLPHRTLGMCAACYHRTLSRLQDILRFTEGEERPDAPRFTPDRLTELASGAVRKQLSAETPPLYVTKAERKAQRKVERDAQREKAVSEKITAKAQQRAERQAAREKAARDRIAATRNKRVRRDETLHQAKALHVEQGLTWNEIAQRLDPEGFLKDPEAAAERIRISVYRRIPLVRDLTDLARAAVRRRDGRSPSKRISLPDGGGLGKKK